MESFGKKGWNNIRCVLKRNFTYNKSLNVEVRCDTVHGFWEASRPSDPRSSWCFQPVLCRPYVVWTCHCTASMLIRVDRQRITHHSFYLTVPTHTVYLTSLDTTICLFPQGIPLLRSSLFTFSLQIRLTNGWMITPMIVFLAVNVCASDECASMSAVKSVKQTHK